MKKELEKFTGLAENKKWEEVASFLRAHHASEAADFFKELNTPTKVLIFKLLPNKFAAKVVSYLSPKQRNALLKNLSNSWIRKILANLNPDDRTELFEDLPKKSQKKLMKLLSSGDLKETKSLLKYPEESVGRLMTPDFISVKPDWTVEKALQHIKKHGAAAETIDVIYVVDSAGKSVVALGQSDGGSGWRYYRHV